LDKIPGQDPDEVLPPGGGGNIGPPFIIPSPIGPQGQELKVLIIWTEFFNGADVEIGVNPDPPAMKDGDIRSFVILGIDHYQIISLKAFQVFAAQTGENAKTEPPGPGFPRDFFKGCISAGTGK
jgi:hypothetical protein